MEEQLSIPGLPEGRSEAWREHTAERWLRDDPESYAECVAAVKRGELNKTHLAKQFGRSRNSVQSLIMHEFSVEQLRDITTKRGMIVAAEALAKADDLIPDARVKELGAVAMAGQIAFGIAQLGSGNPTEIRENRTVLTVDDFNAWMAGQQPAELDVTPPRTGSEAEKVLPIGQASEAVEVLPEASLSGIKPPNQNTLNVGNQRNNQ